MDSKGIKFKDNNGNTVYPCPYYPIGSIYMSVNNINPSNFFGGTWEQIKDRFLLSCGDTYSNGSTGGSSTSGGPNTNVTGSTTLNINQIPSHSHGIKLEYGTTANLSIAPDTDGRYQQVTNRSNYAYQVYGIENKGGGQGHTHTLNNHTHSCMPPYLAVYIWKRIK